MQFPFLLANDTEQMILQVLLDVWLIRRDEADQQFIWEQGGLWLKKNY